MGITQHVGSDCYPGTIVSVSKSGLQFEFQMDESLRTGGSFQTGDWEGVFLRNLYSVVEKAKWSVKRRGGNAWRSKGSTITVGERRFYIDPHF
jgi:hypothetical protein